MTFSKFHRGKEFQSVVSKDSNKQEKKHRIPPPYCWCGVIQVSCSLVWLKTATLRLPKYPWNHSCMDCKVAYTLPDWEATADILA